MTRHKKIRAALAASLVLALAGGFIVSNMQGCNQPPKLTGTLHVSEERSQKLLALASQEAAQITDVDVRLTRLLNLAETQIQRKWLADARATLAAGRNTLSTDDAAKLNEHARISGWVSISQLSREADDNPGAVTACDGAVAAMRKIEDPARRCFYIMGVCNEVQFLKGKLQAAELLSEAAPWTKAIDNVPLRRQALVSFSAALFNLDEYSRGQQMLRQEDDAGWRSQTLTDLAMNTTVPMEGAVPDTRPMQPNFGRTLNYRDIFQGKTNSQTSN